MLHIVGGETNLSFVLEVQGGSLVDRRGYGGVPGTHALPWYNLFIFTHFRKKSLQIIGYFPRIQGLAPSPVWEILDPPLRVESIYLKVTGCRALLLHFQSN